MTSGSAVGLPEGQMGNSEVGHLNIGAGFIVYQWISRIDKAIADGELAANETLSAAIDECIANGSTLHVAGLVSDGGVHSHIRQIIAVIEIAARRGLSRIAVHALTDGRDTPPTSGIGFINDLQAALDRIGAGRIATVSGRYYAMDRDKRWDRTQLAYNAIVSSVGPRAGTAAEAIERSYAAGVTDEFIVPTVIDSVGIQPGDVFLFANFRSDRGRQLTQALAVPDFTGFERSKSVAGLARAITMTRYWEDLPVEILFETHDIEWPLARVISEAERRPGGSVSGRGSLADPLTQGRHVRSAAGNERGWRRRLDGGRDRFGSVRLHRRQFRQPGHGRTHWRFRSRREGG
jgi:2,3-bisphosphoglycerate-independent phosphoglycerate mutase